MTDKKARSNGDFISKRVEKQLVRPGDINHKAINCACQISRRIKNRTNYLIKNIRNLKGDKLSHRDADKILKTFEQALYQKHPSGVAQRMTQIVGAEWKSFYKAIKSYKKAPVRFNAKPKPPKYSRNATTTYIPRNSFKVVNGSIHFADRLKIKPIKTLACQEQIYNSKANATKIKEIRLVPTGSSFLIEIIYDKSVFVEDGLFCPIYPEGESCPVLPRKNKLGIDLGLNNLATCVSNKQNLAPVLIRGKSIKSINALYNKHSAQLKSNKKIKHLNAKAVKRSNRINDYLHKASNYIVSYCIKHDLGVIVIGKNEQWKKEINIGKKNNQNFVSIPHARLVEMIDYKAKNNGITVIVREESYTSKASALDGDRIPDYGDKVIPLFSGKRVKRGLYKTKNGLLLNADVNGALNILRKEFGDEVLALPANKGFVFNPVSISFHCNRNPKRFGTRRITPQRLAKVS